MRFRGGIIMDTKLKINIGGTARNMANAAWQLIHNYLDHVGLTLDTAAATKILDGLQKKDPYYTDLYEILKNNMIG